MFGPAMMSGYAPAMAAAAERTNVRWQTLLAADDAPDVDIYVEMMRLTLEIVVQTLFQMDVQDQSAEMVEAILKLDTGYGFDPLTANLGHLLPAGPERRRPAGDASRARIQAMMQRLFDAALKMPSPPGLIATLLKDVGPENAVNVAVGTMLAMHEVSVTTVTWARDPISQYPDVESSCTTNGRACLAAVRRPSKTCLDLCIPTRF